MCGTTVIDIRTHLRRRECSASCCSASLYRLMSMWSSRRRLTSETIRCRSAGSEPKFVDLQPKLFGYTKYYGVTDMLLALGLPSFDTVIHNYRIHFCVSGAIIAMIRWNYLDVCVRLHFCEFYCVLLYLLYCFFISVCLYVSCLCSWAVLSDLNKMLTMMMMMMKYISA